ncbi:MAG: AAA family ATPase [Cyanobacteria bacterium LVE1205-1]
MGKTVVTTALAAYWKIYCTPKTFGILKTIQTGIGDREFYSRYLSLNQSLDEINPLHYHQPIAPL